MLTTLRFDVSRTGVSVTLRPFPLYASCACGAAAEGAAAAAGGTEAGAGAVAVDARVEKRSFDMFEAAAGGEAYPVGCGDREVEPKRLIMSFTLDDGAAAPLPLLPF